MITLGPEGVFGLRRDTGAIRQFQVMGERGSGTNVLRRTMEKNLKAQRIESLGWKHGFPTMVAIPPDVLVVCVVRNGWDWARSLYARPWHAHPAMQELSFEAFLRAEWRSIVDRIDDFETLHGELNGLGSALQLDRDPITGRPFETLFALRRAKLAALMGYANRHCNVAWVRFEHFAADPAAVLDWLCSSYGMRRKSDDFRAVTRRMGHRFNPRVANRPLAYAQPTPDDLALMHAQLDREQERALGYTYA